jgi:cytoskeletal protein CcmA (bactofilin family)
MFKSTKSMPSTSVKINTVIGSTTSVTGNINATETIRVDGRYIGDIVTEADIIIGERAYIKGNITAVNVSLCGGLEGNVKCTGILEILIPGKLIGDVEVGSLSIDKGAIFNGKCKILYEDVKQLVAADRAE